MVAWQEKSSTSKPLPLKILHFFYFALAATVFSFPTIASSEAQPALAELCLLPGLEKSLAQYQQLAAQGGWPLVSVGPTLREGDRSERIPVLKERLILSDDLTAVASQGEEFDEILKKAVQKFQSRHGLSPDGVVGVKTLAELNVPVSTRIQQLVASLERCQPLPNLLERRHILVNIADFTLKLFEDGKLLFSMPVIVGKIYRQTPVFAGRITSLVLNPSWEVPERIASQDLLPKIKKDPGYLDKLHFRVFKGWNSNLEIDPASIDWAALSLTLFPYRLSQDPGPDNSLGCMKFVLPNPYDVYLHDTPARELFQKDSRTFSSGCIRLARPRDLAIYLLQGTALSTMDALDAAISRQETQEIDLPSPITIYIVYMTAWVDQDGSTQFRPDIYQRNPAL